mmetsp:Transcript_7959/g.10398  ORF Transcript_7959/g.10398 Transcript_7959/m.10398 type:complete len:175 (+) Transcript_7959:125-649(+)
MNVFKFFFFFVCFQLPGTSLAAFGCLTTSNRLEKLDPCSQLRLSSKTRRPKEYLLITSESVAIKASSQDEDGPDDIDVRKILSRDLNEDELSDEVWENVESGAPPKLLVLKELLGINIFTYILAAAIVFFLSANFILGPGWLGQSIGLQGTGTFTDVSESLPNTMNVNDADFLF